MSDKTSTQTAPPAVNAAGSRATESSILSRMTDRARGLYTKAAALLEAQRIDEALSVLRIQGHSDPLLRNLTAVCLLRAGRPADALELCRPLVWAANGLVLRTDVPTEFKTTFATGLLLQGHVSAGITILNAIGDESHPAVQRLRTAIDRWKGSLSFLGRWKHRLGLDPSVPISLDGPPGDLP